MEPKISARWSGALPVRAFVAFDACVRACARMVCVRNTRQKCRNVTSSTHRNENIVHRLLPYRYHACIVFPGGRWSTHACERRALACVSALRQIKPPQVPIALQLLCLWPPARFQRPMQQIRALDANERAIDIDTCRGIKVIARVYF